jgi:microsomal prostaglandin-E synthase 2
VEVDPLLKTELRFSKQYKKVPVVVLGDGELVTDSGVIIARITKELAPHRLPLVISSHATGGEQRGEVKNAGYNFFPPDTDYWVEWSEKKLAVMLYPNITRNLSESFECFGYVSEVDSWSAPHRFFIQTVGSAAMSLANGKIKKKYNIVNERQELKEVLNEWRTAVGTKDFLHDGDLPTLPDLVVHGVLRSIDTTATFREVMTDQVIRTWYKKVSKHVARAESK